MKKILLQWIFKKIKIINIDRNGLFPFFLGIYYLIFKQNLFQELKNKFLNLKFKFNEETRLIFTQ
jgi:hypothetical protein